MLRNVGLTASIVLAAASGAWISEVPAGRPGNAFGAACSTAADGTMTCRCPAGASAVVNQAERRIWCEPRQAS